LASGSELIGRGSELSRLRGLVDPPPADSRVLVLLGEAGMGKTVLLAQAERQARSAGLRVLSAAGRESEQDLAFAGLHQLLRPVLDRVGALPDRQVNALLGALALSPDPVAPDALLTGLAVLTLLSLLAEDGPLLVLIDDGQWVDPASVDALAFAARRLDSERLALLLAARGAAPPAGFERGYPELRLEPLSTQDAARLLDAQPYPPHGRAREQVLGQAAGNPMAIIELAKVIAADPAAGRRWASEPLPPTQRLAAIITAQYRALPPATRQALLLAAVADRPEVPAGVPGLTASVLAPAENSGLIRVDSAGIQFSHPLVRAAVYHAVPFAERAAAHLTMADTLRGQPDRYAWQLAAAALEPDEHVALLLEETAAQARRRGGDAAAARALERAADLSPGKPDQARRLLAAGEVARHTGQSDWVQELAARVLTLATDQELRITARYLSGWALIWSNRHTDALPTLLSVAEQAPSRLPIAWSAIALAATVAYHSGTPAACQAVLTTFNRMHEPPQPSADWAANLADTVPLWIRASTNPFGDRGELIPSLRRIASGTVSEPADIGATAWLLDETELAVRMLREDLSRVRERGRYGPVLSALQWACIDSGRWDDTLTTARETADTAAAYKMDTIAASADLATATVLALRGDRDRVQPLITSALARIDATADRATAARARHAAGIAALADGSYTTAYARLRTLFDADGTPLHHHISYLAIADLAAAAARAERHLEAQTLIERALAQVDPAPGPRLHQLAARTRVLLAGNASAEADAGKALADPAGATWPFERAQLQLDYGEWLRRRRRINDAKPVLAAALETLRGLGATPWVRRAEAELRACGVTAQAAATAPGALAELTPQQRQIVILASRGLTNGEIADRLFLSPRTVAYHLYNSYPKLGIAGRHQLRDLIDQATDPPAAPPAGG
jgi:DNA-binding CsgD family transcriptional regulator